MSKEQTVAGQDAQQQQKTMPELLAIVSVDSSRRVRCGEPNCGHSVYAAIHVVEDEGELLVLGSTCFAKRFGFVEALGPSRYGGGDCRELTEAERQMLVNNTAALLAQFELERQQAAERAEAARLSNRIAPSLSTREASTPSIQGLHRSPWSWMKPVTSMAYFHLRDGTGWVRVQHRDGRQMLLPWPAFDGWEEALPARIGTPEPVIGGLALHDVVSTVSYLREHGVWDKVSGDWREIVGAIAKRKPS